MDETSQRILAEIPTVEEKPEDYPIITQRKFWLYSEKKYVFKTPVLVFGRWADTIQRACMGRGRGAVRMDQIDRFGDGGLCPDTNDKIVFVVSKDY